MRDNWFMCSVSYVDYNFKMYSIKVYGAFFVSAAGSKRKISELKAFFARISTRMVCVVKLSACGITSLCSKLIGLEI